MAGFRKLEWWYLMVLICGFGPTAGRGAASQIEKQANKQTSNIERSIAR
jgi:hypothetical protein